MRIGKVLILILIFILILGGIIMAGNLIKDNMSLENATMQSIPVEWSLYFQNYGNNSFEYNPVTGECFFNFEAMGLSLPNYTPVEVCVIPAEYKPKTVIHSLCVSTIETNPIREVELTPSTGELKVYLDYKPENLVYGQLTWYVGK